MSKPSKNLTFETAMARFESLIDKLETGQVNLEDSVKYFEEGMMLSQYCEKKLGEAEGKIRILQADKSEKSLDDIDELKES